MTRETNLSFHNEIMCRLVSDFIDLMLRESASRAVVKDAPLSFREGKERWADALEKRAVFLQRSGGRFFEKASGQHHTQSNRGRGGANRGRGTGGNRGGALQRGRGAKFQGHSVCYHYNRASGCSRPTKGTGCDNGNGGEYAHVCNHEISPGVYCLQAHAKATFTH